MEDRASEKGMTEENYTINLGAKECDGSTGDTGNLYSGTK